MGDRAIAILSPGEMGSQVGRVLREDGARVVTCLDGRSEGSSRRARDAGFEALPTLEDVIAQVDLVIAIVPSLSALPVAREVAEAMATTGKAPLYLDANSISPGTAREIEATLARAGGEFVDGSIIGTSQQLRGRTVFYLSGARAADVASLLQPTLTTEILGTAAGQASGFKVLYAGLTKGLSSLGVELLGGADRLGLLEPLLAKYRASHPSVLEFWESTLPGLPQRAGRRSEEMIELAETLEDVDLQAHMAHGAHQTLAGLARQYHADPRPDFESIDDMIEWLASHPI